MIEQKYRDIPFFKSQNHRQMKWNVKKPVHGFDTETYRGKAVLIASDEEILKSFSFEEVLSFLTKHKYRYTYNFFFNIKYDVGAIMRWLGEEQFIEFVKTNQLIYETNNRLYRISYIPGKLYSIKYKTKNGKKIDTVNYYDLMNYYEGSLDKNAKQYLNKSKLNIINTSRLNVDKEYWHRVCNAIKKYLRRDCEITKLLGEKLQSDMFNVLGIHPKKYISKANIAENWLYTVGHIPTINKIWKTKPDVIRYTYRGYYGGRFECLKKGHYEGTIYDYDINSAYPTTMRNLLNINEGEWIRVEQPNTPDMGIYKCEVKIPKCYLAPMGIKINQQLLYAQNYTSIFYLNEEEIKIYNPYCNIKVIDGYEFYAKKKVYPFMEPIDKLFELKAQNKKYGKHSMEYLIPKILLNSLYGKTVQINKNNNTIGKMFNPIYGQRITADTRMKIFLAAIQAGNKLVTIETDGIKTTKPINVNIGNKKGQWELNLLGELYIVGNGLFEAPGEIIKKRGIFQKNFALKKITKTAEGDTYQYKRIKAITMKEAIIQHKYTWEDTNIWLEVKKELKVNNDRGRCWERWDYTWEEVGNNWIDSKPWDLEELKDEIKES